MTKKPIPSFTRTKTFEYEGAKITSRCATIMTQVAKEALYERLMAVVDKAAGGEFLHGYTDAVAQNIEASGLPFELPVPDADVDVHVTAFQQYVQLPLDLIAQWMEAIRSVNAPAKTNTALQPGLVTDDPKA